MAVMEEPRLGVPMGQSVFLHQAVEAEKSLSGTDGGRYKSFLRSWKTGGEEGVLNHKEQEGGTLGAPVRSQEAFQMEEGQVSCRRLQATRRSLLRIQAAVSPRA